MDLLSIWIIRIIGTLAFLLATIINSTVTYLVLMKTPKEHRNFSILILAFSISQLINTLFGWSTLSRVGLAAKREIRVLYGVCTIFGDRFCYVIDQFPMFFHHYEMFLVPVSISYRLYVFFKKPPKAIFVYAILLLMIVPYVDITAFLLSRYINPLELVPLLTKEEKDDIGGFTFFGIYEKPGWQATYLRLGFFIPFICAGITFVIRYILVHKILKVAGHMSDKTKALHRSLATMLMAQACVNLIGIFGGMILFYALFSSDPIPFICSLLFIIGTWCPILDGLAVMTFVSHYRNIVKSWFKKVAEPPKPTSSVNSGVTTL